MSARPFPDHFYRVPDPADTRIPELEARVRELEAALIEANDAHAKAILALVNPLRPPVSVVRGHVLFEFPIPPHQAASVVLRGTARLLMAHGYAWSLAMELCEASLNAEEQRREILAACGNLPRTPEEERLLAGERP